jgi:hypothetical protein
MTRRKRRYDELFNAPTEEDEERLSAALHIIGTVFDGLLTERQQALLYDRYPKMRGDLMDLAGGVRDCRRRHDRLAKPR